MKRRVTMLLALGSVVALAAAIAVQVRADREADQGLDKPASVGGACCGIDSTAAEPALKESGEAGACCPGASNRKVTASGDRCPAGGCPIGALTTGCTAAGFAGKPSCCQAEAECCPDNAGCCEEEAGSGCQRGCGQDKGVGEKELAEYGNREA